MLFSVADTYVGTWMADLMSWLVISSLFAGLLAFQNSAARYFYAMGRAGVLPRMLDRVNGRGAPVVATLTTSVISFVVIVIFVAKDWDPVLNLFYWFSGLAVIAIVFVEILVSVAVIAFFSRHRGEVSIWASLFAPTALDRRPGRRALAPDLALRACWPARSRTGSTRRTQPWALNTTGWILVLTPFVMFVVGTIVGQAAPQRRERGRRRRSRHLTRARRPPGRVSATRGRLGTAPALDGAVSP